MTVCERVYIGSLSCDIVRFENDGNQINFSATLLEQPFADDTPTHGLAVSSSGFAYLAGTTGFAPTNRAIIERFNEDLTGGVEWVDLSLLNVPPMTSPFALTPMVIGLNGHIFIWAPAKVGLPFPDTYPMILFEFDPTGTLLNSWQPAGLTAAITDFVSMSFPLHSMDMTPGGILILNVWGSGVFYRFDPTTGMDLPIITLNPNRFVTDIVVLDNNTILGSTVLPNINSVYQFKMDGTTIRTYDVTEVGYSGNAPFFGPFRMLSRGPNATSFWVTAAIENPPASGIWDNHVILVDLVVGTHVLGGKMTTNFTFEAIINMAVCSKQRRRALSQATLIGAT